MFAVIEPGGINTTYVPGVFRNRKITKVPKITPTKPLGRQETSKTPDQLEGDRPFQVRAYENISTLTPPQLATISAEAIMSSPVLTLPVTASIHEAWEMVQVRRFRHIPILNEEGTLTGILSDRDLALGMVESVEKQPKQGTSLGEKTLHPYMSFPVLIARPETGIGAIAKVFFEERIGAMPILSSEGNLKGIVTRADILRTLVAHPNFDRWV